MKKKNLFRIMLCSGLAAMMAFTAVACGGNPDDDDDEDIDPNAITEKRQLTLSTTDPDGVFNPFFSSSLVDSNMVSMTQISMLNSDKNGNLVYGDNEPTVAQDYSIRTAKENGQDYTTYQFVIKKDIKFSDGSPLTIKDVLFNLYVYLDPAYTGSSTIYSTDIVGLDAYRTQNPNANADSIESFNNARRGEAQSRITDLKNYVYYNSDFTDPADKNGKYDIGYLSEAELERAAKDFLTVTTEFRKELESDWNNVSSSFESYAKNNGFTAIWQPFLVSAGNEDLYLHEKNQGGEDLPTFVKDKDGNRQFDPNSENTKTCVALMNLYLEEKGVEEGDDNYAETVKNWAIDYVFQNNIGVTDDGKTDITQTSGDNFAFILNYWETGNTILTNFTAEATTEYFNKLGKNLPVPNISGITASDGRSFVPSSESSASNAKYSKDYDLLQIKIKGVDPKAIFNFSFIVAPMHYYAQGNYKSSRTGETLDYSKSFDISKNNFGVAYGETDFMNDILKKNVGVPLGAGAYMASNRNGGDGSDVSANGNNGFWNRSTNTVYFKRNPYFKTVGENLKNAKIKYVQYKVISSDMLVESLRSGEIDFGEPSATQDNIGALDSAGVAHVEVQTNGYGYVGINSRFVPNIKVRRAIIKAMNIQQPVDEYYRGGLAETIYRPMSKASWAYPLDATTYVSKDDQTSYAYDDTGKEIQALLDRTLTEDGYQIGSDGIYVSADGSDRLDYEFTIAGGSTDHPSYKMFLDAAQLLNTKVKGIRVNVVTSQQALSDLTMGKLKVWAAAWTSTIDPDMYQTYHKDSLASSPLNWGYDYIKGNTEKYAYEWSLVQQISEKIDLGRTTNNRDSRKQTYAQTLDLVMELAVELPVYQRKDMFAYNAKVLDVNTMQHNEPDVAEGQETLTPFNGPLSRIWEVNYVAGLK